MIPALIIGGISGGFILAMGAPWWAAGGIALLAGLFQAGAE